VSAGIGQLINYLHNSVVRSTQPGYPFTGRCTAAMSYRLIARAQYTSRRDLTV